MNEEPSQEINDYEFQNFS